MYEQFYGLRERPFNVTPDPRFLYLSPHHREALAHLQYGVQARRGFVVITGEVGTGKTTLVHTLLNGLNSSTRTAVIFSTYLTAKGLLRLMIADFGIKSKAKSKTELLLDLNAFLLQQFSSGANAVLIVDEAHNLSFRLLEEIRMLSNLETDREKLLQIILVGQPELATKLAMPRLRQLRQRISSRYHIRSLNRQEVTGYIQHRLRVAGVLDDSIFDAAAVDKIYQRSGGIPRLINSICDAALLLGYTYEKKRIGAAIIAEVVSDLTDWDTAPISSREPETIAVTAAEENGKSLSLWPRVIRPITVACGLLLLVVLSVFILSSEQGNNFSSVPKESETLTKPESKLTQISGEEKKALPVQIVPKVKKESFEKVVEEQESGYYSVHVASFEELDRAKRLEQIMRRNGFEPVFIVPVQFPETGRWLRVLVGRYQDKEAALRDAKRFLASGTFDYAKPQFIKEVDEDEHGALPESRVMTSQIPASQGVGHE